MSYPLQERIEKVADIAALKEVYETERHRHYPIRG
jgi:hypothetical protein